MGWISVKDKLPEPDELVITYPNYKKMTIGLNNKFWVWDCDCDIIASPQPTHWMSLKL